MLYDKENTPSVYVIHSTSGHFKIGYSKNPDTRLKQLQKTQGVYEYSLIQVIPFMNLEEARAFESGLHEDYKERRIRGEWFELTPKDLIEIGAIGELHFQTFLCNLSPKLSRRYKGAPLLYDLPDDLSDIIKRA